MRVQVGGQEGEGELRHWLHPLPGPAGAAHPAEGARGQTGPVSQWLSIRVLLNFYTNVQLRKPTV